MTAIPFAISSSPGVKPQEGAGRLINCFAVKNETGARFPVLWRGCAGLRDVAAGISSHSHLRGAILVGSTLILALNSRAYTVTKSGSVYTAVNQGALAGTDPVTIAKNSAGTPNIVCVSTEGVSNLFTGSAPTSFADADLPQPKSVSEYKNYFIFPIGDGRIFSSSLNGVSISTSAFTTAPGPLHRGVSFRGEFFAFGDTFIQPYRDAGTSPFPLEPSITGGGVIPRGIVGTHAVAGWEPGWSNELIWAGDDYVVYRLDGYTPAPISNDDVSRDIAAAVLAGDGNSLEASVYMQGSYAIWRLTYPGNWTWEYNKTTGNWHQRKSYGRTDCRGSTTIKAFDRWLSGDRTSGKLFQIDETHYREGDDPLRMILRSGVFAAFPSRLAIPRMDFDFTAAVGMAAGENPVQTDPSVLISLSHDGGFSFGNPVARKLGRQGDGNARVTVLRCGVAGPKGVVVELEVADPVHRTFMGGQMATAQRAA